jgi:hypothetical protein
MSQCITPGGGRRGRRRRRRNNLDVTLCNRDKQNFRSLGNELVHRNHSTRMVQEKLGTTQQAGHDCFRLEGEGGGVEETLKEEGEFESSLQDYDFDKQNNGNGVSD